jgi:lipopolysaccharide export system protein LptA
MDVARCNHVWCRLGEGVVLAALGLLLLGGLRPGAWAQAVDDTTEPRPTEVPPADLDSLPTTGDLTPSLEESGPEPPASDTGTVDRAFVTADSLSTFQRGGEQLQEMFGDVFVRQDTTRIRSQYALRYLNRDEVLFVDDVVMYERGDTLRADTVRYNRATEVGRARSNVRLTNGDVNVRSDRAIYYDAEQRSVFPDSVVLVDSNRVLRARSGTYWSNEQRAEFGGGVRLTEPGTTLLSDSLTYYREQERSIARGNVFVDRRGEEGAQTDTTSRTYLFGDWVDNREARRYSRGEGDALLVRVRMDSTGAPADTLVVDARRLEAFRTDTHRRLVAVGSVRIWQPDLSAVADSAVYDRVVAATPDSAVGQPVAIDSARAQSDSASAVARRATLRPPGQKPPRPEPDSTWESTAADRSRPDADAPPDTTRSAPTARTAARPDSLAGRRARATPDWAARQWDTPTARADSALPLEETRLFRDPVTWFEGSQVWGDSIRVRARNREPDTVFVRGSAFAAQQDSVLDRIQQLKGRNLAAFFESGSLRRIRAEPNSRAIRFMAAENDSLNGAARTSGDRIVLRFRDGDVRRISVVGGTQTTYYRDNENIPDPFELEGFQWTPDRRPTRQGLLRDERVLQRLDLDLDSPPRRRPPAARGTPERPVPDTMASSPRRSPSGSMPAANRPRGTPVPDSLRYRETVPPDSANTLLQPAPSDTTETTRNPNP